MQANTGFVVALCFAAVLVQAASGAAEHSSPGSSPVPRLSLNLDLPPEERWAPVLRHWDLNSLNQLFRQIIKTYFPPEALPLIDVIGEALDDLMPKPYSQEIRGVAKTLNIAVGEMACLNMFYDFTAACTSIVAEDSNGTIWHGRNLDYPQTPETLKNITAIIDYQSQGQTIYTTTSFVGQVGVFTGMKPNKFSISLNERDYGDEEENFIDVLQALLLKKIRFSTFIIRDVLAEEDSYEDVVSRLVTEQQVSPSYFIVAGVKSGEGAVITRERTYTLDVWQLDLKQNRWFVLETNYDRWTPPPPSDDRRDPAIKAMNAVGQSKINDKTMWDVLSLAPILNEETVYTAIMCPSRPEIYISKVRTQTRL